MRNNILVFLSRFSVKHKLAILILFFVFGIVFWNVTYLTSKIQTYYQFKKGYHSLLLAQNELRLLLEIEKRRSHALEYLCFTDIQQPNGKFVKSSNNQLLQTIMNEPTSSALKKAFNKQDDFEQYIIDRAVDADEVLRYYSDTYAKHLIDALSLARDDIHTRAFTAIFLLANAIEYAALRDDLILATACNEVQYDKQWDELIISQEAKSQTFLNQFAFYSTKTQKKKLYDFYSSRAFITYTQLYYSADEMNAMQYSQFYEYSEAYIAVLASLLTKSVTKEVKSYKRDMDAQSATLIFDVAILVLPMIIALIISYFVFIDVQISLMTMLRFLDNTDTAPKRDRKWLLGAKSEFGTVFRSLFSYHQQIQKQIRQIRHNYEYDQLTTLPNRNKLFHYLKRNEHHEHCFVIFLDVNNFAHINDSFGDKIGDVFLKKCAKYLKQEVINRQSNVERVFRVGADEYVLLLSKEYFTNSLLKRLASMHILNCDGLELPLMFTFGIVESKVGLYQNMLFEAEIASRKAHNSHSSYAYYDRDDAIESVHKENLNILKQINSAFEFSRFHLHYQPIISTHDKAVDKYEVLVRMYNEEGEVIRPNRFLSVLQHAGFENELTRYVVHHAFESLLPLKVNMSINFTKDDLNQEMFNYLVNELESSGMPVERVTIELVENETIMKPQFTNVIQQLRTYGFKIAIDDFGSGYSNFSYLTKIKPDYIKIDGSLIENMDTDQRAAAIVEGIVQFAKTLNAAVIAEYVSSEQLFRQCAHMGIALAQGYYGGASVDNRGLIMQQGE